MISQTATLISTDTCLSFLAFLVISINSYCLVIILLSQKLHKSSNIAVSSLIFAHLIQGLFVIPLYILKRSNVQSSLVCDLYRFSYMLTNYAACLSLLIITLDRFLHLKMPFKYRVYSTVYRMRIVLLCMWIYTLGLCLIPFANKTSNCYYNPTDVWTASMLICNTCVPFFIAITLYIMIFKKAWNIQKRKRINKNLKFTYLNKSIRVFLIIFCFLICWGPSCVYYLLNSLCYSLCFNKKYHNTSIENGVTLFMKIMTFLDGIVAPLLYCVGNRSFKSASRMTTTRFKMTLKNFWKKQSIHNEHSIDVS
ncbi:beta-1 adrenergic receptor [Hydra vulgaris]|uniref:beta-1 adrenergic receptor n=1 Tax=Hydra vulgaris TaxID=6087 RepID=UPI001F5F5DE0|nr:beta-1 adrenergic receptor [Hydra vulgaris]